MTSQRDRRRCRDDDGGIIAEMALFAPLLLVLAIGILEFGMAWRDSITVSNTLRAGARVGSNLAEQRLADYSTIESVRAAVADIPNSQIDKLVTYDAGINSDGSVPKACTRLTSGGLSGQCNVYSSAQLQNLAESDFTGTTSCTGSSPDRFWCPVTDRSSSGSNPDNFGVWISVQHDYLTGVFPGDGITITDSAVMRLEPQPPE